MAAKQRDPDGFSKAKASPEGFSKSRATGEDDVEGHSMHRGAEDFSKAKASPEGFSKSRAAGEDDVEGHSMLINPLVAREISRARERDVQANVKRHNFENDARAAKKDRG
jgi:hypothetical protein